MSNYRLRFLRLTGHNVCSYPDFDINLTNQGSVLLCGRNGSGKCVVGSTRVPTDRGLIPIDQVVDGSKPEGFRALKVKVATARGNQTTRRSYHQVVSHTVSLRTEIGLGLEATPEHPILTITKKGFVYKRLSDVVEGDYVAVSRGSDLWSFTDADLSGFEVREGHRTHLKYYKTPSRMNPDLAWLCGALLANGNFDDRHLKFCSQRQILIERYQRKMEQVFGVVAEARLREDNTFYVDIGSKFILEFLEFLDFRCGRSASKRVPETILRSTRDCVMAFLEGYIETDSGSDSGYFYLSSASQEVTRTLQLVFLNLGAVGRLGRLTRNLKTRGETPYWTLTFDGEATQRIVELFPNYHKQINLRTGVPNPNKDVIPYVNGWLRKARESLDCKASGTIRFPDGTFRRGHTMVDSRTDRVDRGLGYARLQRDGPQVLDTYKELRHPVAKDLEFLLETHFYWDKVVVRKDHHDEKQVFDFEVDPENPTFVGNGIVNHNSTPFYALTHLLYSMTSKGVRYKDLINIHDPRDYHVRLDLEIDGVPYAIEEFREHRLHGSCRIIWRNGQDVTPQGERAVKAYIPRLLNLDQQSFLSNVFLSQEHTHLLVEGRPADRQKHIMWLFGLHAFDRLASEAKRERDALKHQIADVERIQEEILDIDDQLKELPTRSFARRGLSEAKTEQKGLEKEITVLEGRRTRLAERVTKVEIRDNLVDELRGLGLDDSPTATDVAELAQHVTELVDTLAQAKSDLVLVRKAEQLRAELENYRELPPVTDLTKQLERVQEQKLMATEVTLPRAKRAAKLRSKINKITRDETDHLEDFEAKEIEFKTHIKTLTRRIKELGHQIKKGVCPTCKRPWDLSLEELQTLKTTLTDARGRLDDVNKRYYALHARAEDARQFQQLTQKLKSLPDRDPQDVEIEITTLIQQEAGLRSDITVATQRQEIRAKLEDVPEGTVALLRERVTRITGQLMKTRTLYNQTKQAHELLRRIADLPTGDLSALRSDLNEVDQALKDASIRAKDVQVAITESTADLREIDRLMEQRRAKEQRVHSASSAIRDSRIWEALRQGFGLLLRKREHKLLQRITKELPTYFNPLFGGMSQWCSVELCKEASGGIDIQVVARDRLLPPKAPSPGMKAKLGISLLFALRDLYAQNQCNLIVLDEPLWKIDQEARPAFLEILDQLKQKVETLIITTHEQEIKGHAFDNRWEAQIENGLSVLHS